MLVDGRGSIAKVQYTGDEDVQAIKQLLAAVVESEDEFEKWEPLVTHAMSLEGGVTRNSNPSAIELVRNVYDCFLAKFPLFFGYWKKYADFEFAIGGTDTAEMIYERGVACIPTCVDLWRDYCEFKMNTCHDPEIVRELFERAADFVTMDFQSHPFWDKYIEFEDRNNDQIRKIKIWRRVFQLPNYYFGKYYEKFRAALGGDAQNLEEIVEEEVYKAIKASVDIENQGFNRTPPEIHRQIYAKLDEYYLTAYTKNQAFLHARWHFEQAIKRAYFHVTELEEDELENWRKYLDFEEKEGTFNSISALYERCLVPCALYEEFWLRYARWLFAQNKEEECRIVYTRASCIFVPVSQPTIRLNWARFEEKLGYVNKARDIHMAILEQAPDHVETIISLAGVDRRHKGNDAAVRTLDDYINGVDRRHEVDDPNALDAYVAKRNSQVGGVLAAEQARILWKCKGAIDEARQIFKEKYEKFLDSKQFWLKYLEFEASQISSDEEDSHARVKAIHDLMRAKGRFPPATTKELSHYYMEYLLDFAGKDAAGEFMLLDREINGYVSSKNISLPPAGHAKPHSTAKKRKHKNKAGAAAGSI